MQSGVSGAEAVLQGGRGPPHLLRRQPGCGHAVGAGQAQQGAVPMQPAQFPRQQLGQRGAAAMDHDAPRQRRKRELHFMARRQDGQQQAVVVGRQGAGACADLLDEPAGTGEQHQPSAVHRELGIGGVADGDADRATGQGIETAHRRQLRLFRTDDDGGGLEVMRSHEQRLRIPLHRMAGGGDERIHAVFAQHHHAVGGADGNEAHLHAHAFGEQPGQRRLEALRTVVGAVAKGRIVRPHADADLLAAADAVQDVEVGRAIVLRGGLAQRVERRRAVDGCGSPGRCRPGHDEHQEHQKALAHAERAHHFHPARA